MKEIKEESEQKSYKSIAQKKKVILKVALCKYTFIFILFRHPDFVY